MGYYLNTIYSISADDSHSYFVFMLGGTYGLVNSTQEWLDKNFSAIAKALGPKAAIVRGLSPNFEAEVVSAYQEQIKTRVINFDIDQRTVEKVILGLSEQYHTPIETPLLFITDRNPHKANDKNSIFYIVPVGNLNEPETQDVIETILSCIRTNDFSLLDKWISKNSKNAPLNVLKVLNEILELKPGIAGVSINLNAIIERFLSKEDTS